MFQELIQVFDMFLFSEGKNENGGCFFLVVLVYKGLHSSNFSAEDERVDVVRALVRVYCFQVDHVSHNVILVLNTVASEHISSSPGDVERGLTVLSLQNRNFR